MLSRVPPQVKAVQGWLDSGTGLCVLYIQHGAVLLKARCGGLGRSSIAAGNASVALLAAGDLSLEQIEVKQACTAAAKRLDAAPHHR
jgi:hypothetical protein